MPTQGASWPLPMELGVSMDSDPLALRTLPRLAHTWEGLPPRAWLVLTPGWVPAHGPGTQKLHVFTKLAQSSAGDPG